MMADRRLTLVLLALTVIVFLVAAPAALREAFEHGEFYVFTKQFLTDIPKRLTGPGRFRFILQPTLATFWGFATASRMLGPDGARTSWRSSQGGKTDESWQEARSRRPQTSC